MNMATDEQIENAVKVASTTCDPLMVEAAQFLTGVSREDYGMPPLSLMQAYEIVGDFAALVTHARTNGRDDIVDGLVAAFRLFADTGAAAEAGLRMAGLEE